MACMAYFSICISKVIQTYHPISWLLLFGLIILFNNVNIFNKKYKKDIVILSILFSFLLTYGESAYSIMNSKDISIFSALFSVKSFFSLIGTFNLIYLLLTYIFPKLVSYKMKNKQSIIKKKWIIFIISFLVIITCWLPYFLSYYPGILSPDSLSELGTVINNFTTISDHHPVLHILFIAIPYNIGKSIFGTVTMGVALSTILQMSIMSLIFSSFIVFLYNRKVNDFILLIVLLFYALMPMHGYYSITMWKDVIFGGLLLLLTMETIKVIEKANSDSINIKSIISFIIVSLLCIFFRNNAIYMYILLAIFTIFMFKKYYKTFIISFLIVFGTYFIVKGPIFDYFNVEKSSSAEYIGMPLQQVGRMAFKNIEFNKNEKKLIDELIPLETLSTTYNPVTSDGIKFNKEYNVTAFDSNKSDYFKLWLNLVIKHPDIAIEAYTISTLGYWYPGVQYWSVSTVIEENNFNLHMYPKIPDYIRAIFPKLESREMPIFNIQWSIGFCFWTLLIFGIVAFKKNKWNALYPYIPIFGIWLTMMIASPVFGEFRYVYGAFTCLPLLMLCPFFKLKKIINKTN